MTSPENCISRAWKTSLKHPGLSPGLAWKALFPEKDSTGPDLFCPGVELAQGLRCGSSCTSFLVYNLVGLVLTDPCLGLGMGGKTGSRLGTFPPVWKEVC